MATRKSTTKAKTKKVTAKKTTKTSSKSAKSNATTISSEVSRRPRAAANILQLRRILRLSLLLYILLAVAAVMLMNPITYELTIGYLTKDELASQVATVFAPATTVIYDIEVRWLVVALLVISLALPLLYLTRLERSYAERLRGRVIPWRWIDLGVTAALMLEAIALISGAQDVMTLKLIGGLAGLSAVLAWIAERQNENAARPVWSAYIASFISGLLPWLLIAVYALATPFYGFVRSPWYVYALYAAGGVGLLLLAINQFNQHRRFRAWKDYLTVERNYLLINVATKAAFAAILIAGFRN